MPLIVLKDKNVREIIERAIKVKAKAYRYHIREGLIKQAKYIFHEWKALTELADLLGVYYKTIMQPNKEKGSENYCLEISMNNEKLLAIVVPINIEFSKKQIIFLTKILGGTENKENWYKIIKIPK